ncbi:MAG: hypothetical protein ACI30K_00930 [Muribaculaceae bacterium]
MKHFGCISNFAAERNAELLRTFRLHLAAAKHVVMPQIFRRVANSPSSRFWVSESRAAIVVAAMANGKELPRMTLTKREMYNEIYHRYKELARYMPGEPLADVVALVVHQPAPKFYLTPRTVGELIYRTRHKRYGKCR